MTKPRNPSLSLTSRTVLAILCQLIKSARLERGISQQELAERVGISRHTVMAIEKADPKVAIGAVLEAAAILGVPLLAEDRDDLNRLATTVSNIASLLPARGQGKKVKLDDNF